MAELESGGFVILVGGEGESWSDVSGFTDLGLGNSLRNWLGIEGDNRRANHTTDDQGGQSD